MPRPQRTQVQGITHHVFSRCIEKRALLHKKNAARMFIQVMVDTQEKYNFNFIGYQIMHNHFHFIIQTIEGEASISRIIQYIKARYAERYNKLHDRTGPFWNERFKDEVIEFSDNPLDYLMWLLWYLAFNPVRMKFVNDPRDCTYSSIKCYLDETFKSPVKIVRHSFFNSLGSSFAEQVKQFLFYEEAYLKRMAVMF